jgi:hypothetical protein
LRLPKSRQAMEGCLNWFLMTAAAAAAAANASCCWTHATAFQTPAAASSHHHCRCIVTESWQSRALSCLLIPASGYCSSGSSSWQCSSSHCHGHHNSVTPASSIQDGTHQRPQGSGICSNCPQTINMIPTIIMSNFPSKKHLSHFVAKQMSC